MRFGSALATLAWLSSAATALDNNEIAVPAEQGMRELSTAVTYGAARKVRIQMTQGAGNFLQLKEVQVIASNGTNIALNKAAAQSNTLSVEGETTYAASNAVDGDTTTFSSTSDQTDYWEVDLGAKVNDIQFVKIYNNDNGGNLTNATIQLIDDDESSTVLSSKSVGDMSGIKEKAFEVGYHNSDPLWAIALGESSVASDFDASATSDNLNMKFQIGRGRVRVSHSVYASCDTEEVIDLPEGTGVTAQAYTHPVDISPGKWFSIDLSTWEKYFGVVTFVSGEATENVKQCGKNGVEKWTGDVKVFEPQGQIVEYIGEKATGAGQGDWAVDDYMVMPDSDCGTLAGYSIAEVEHTPPEQAAAQGEAVDSDGNKYPSVESSTTDFPFPSTRLGCLQFCAILPGQANQVGMEADMDDGGTVVQKCRCLYNKGTLPETIPSYAKYIENDGSGEIQAVEMVEGVEGGAAVPTNPNSNCYPFSGINTGLDRLELKYDFNKGSLTGSNIYNATTSQLKLCQIVRLEIDMVAGRNLQEDGDAPAPAPLVVAEQKEEIIVNFEMQRDFSVTDGVSLDKATIEANNQNTTLSDYVRAYKCNANGEEEINPTALPPNTLLHVCIASTSPDVLIDSVEEMKITGTDPNGNGSELRVIQSGHSPVYPSITEISEQDKQTVKIDTRVATNLFNFEQADASIDITGSVILMFKNGRKLTMDMSNRMLQETEEDSAEFEVIINLKADPEGENVDAMMNSAKTNAVFAIFAMVFVSAFALW